MNARKALIAYLKEQGIETVYTFPVPPRVKLPYAVLTLVSCVPDQDSLTETDGFEYLWQIDVYARNYEDADMLRDALERALNRPGEWPEIGGVPADYCRLESFADFSDLEQDGSEKTTVRYEMEFRIRTER